MSSAAIPSPGQTPAPTRTQILAAKVRIKADVRLGRETPADIRAIAQADPDD